MKTLYMECSMGAAGDMLMSALYELLDDKESYLSVLNSLNLPDICYEAEQVSSCGITGTQIHIKINGVEEGAVETSHEHGHNHEHGHHAHNALSDIVKMIDEQEKMVKYILKHTTSNGVRVRRCGKYYLQPSFEQVDTEYGRVQFKKASALGITHTKVEYEDLARIAREKDLPFQAVFESAAKYYKQL